MDEKEKLVLQETRIMELEKANAILKRHVNRSGKSNVVSRPPAIDYSASLLKAHQNKSHRILRKFTNKVPQFSRRDLMLQGEELGAGVFGTVQEGFIRSIQQKVAVKIFNDKLSVSDILAEAVITLEMSGHSNFPFVFGMVEPDKLILEFIGNDTTAPSLRDVISSGKSISRWKIICLDLTRALHALHKKGLLHNDLHSRNILVRNEQYVKIIDFGKSTLTDDPVCYAIKPGTPKHTRYNTKHLHLAYELRNVPGSCVSPQSDIYSLGHNFDHVGRNVQSSQLVLIAAKMQAALPSERPDLSQVLLQISRLK